jgi:hypothetical protein
MAKALRSRKGWATKVSKVHGDSLSADFEAAAKYMEAAATMLGVHLPTEAAKDVHKAKPASTLDKADSVKYACDKDVRELVEALAAIEKVTWRERTSDVNIANTYQRWLTECRAIASKALSHFDAKPEASVEGRWRPIETAPKDGTWIIGSELNEYGKWARYITYYTASMPWSEQWLFDHDEESEYCPAGWFKETSDDEIVNSCKPTHWMPLPAAPKLSTEAGDGK